MVELLAIQSIDKKIELKSSVMVGNYEFYYASGLLSKYTALDADGTTPPEALKEKLETALESFTPADAEQEYLVGLLQRYKPVERFDEQMTDLFQCGATGAKPKE